MCLIVTWKNQRFSFDMVPFSATLYRVFVSCRKFTVLEVDVVVNHDCPVLYFTVLFLHKSGKRVYNDC